MIFTRSSSFSVIPIAIDINNLPELTGLTFSSATGTIDGLTEIKTTSDFFTTGIFSTTASAPKAF